MRVSTVCAVALREVMAERAADGTRAVSADVVAERADAVCRDAEERAGIP